VQRAFNLKAIIHIGTEKTGTSSIQMFLYKNRKKLIKSGYHFLQSAGKTNNWALPAFFSVDDRFNDLYRDEGIKSRQEIDQFKLNFLERFQRELRAVKKNVHTVIISSEHLHSRIRTKEEMDDLHQFLSGYFDEIKIVCYLREQAATCTSWYSTSMKSGGTLTFPEFLQRCRPGNYYFNYYEVLSNWERNFGIESLDIALFAQDQFLNGDLLDDFTARLDPVLVGTLNKSFQSENESLRPVGQALTRAVNLIFPVSLEDPEVVEIRSRCKKLIFQSLSGRGQQPGLDVHETIFESFSEINERLRLKYFPEIKVLFRPPGELPFLENDIDEMDFEVIASIFNVISKHGSDGILSEGYKQACLTITSCIDEVTRSKNDVGEDVKANSVAVMLDEEDARLLSRAAARLKSRDPNSAYRLMTLACKVGPSLPGIRLKLNEYRTRGDQLPKRQYIITYQGGRSAMDQDQLFHFRAGLKKWMASLDVSDGSPLYTIDGSNTIHSDGSISVNGEPSLVGFTIFQAESLDMAVAIARKCPYLEFGATLEVSEFR
jgi:hypothetical protein